MRMTNPKREIVGMYHTDSALIAKTQISEPYWLHNTDESTLDFLPVLDFIRINPNEEIKFCNGNGSEYLETYNIHNRFTPASEEIVKKRKIDVSQNSLFGNDINIVINLTGLNLTLTFNNGWPNMYRPLDIPKLAHKHAGCLLIVTVTCLNSPKSVSDVYGVSNYLSVLRQKHAGKLDHHSEFLTEACDFLTDCLASEVITARALSDTIKLVSMVRVGSAQFKTITADGGLLVGSGYGGDILVEAVCPTQAKLHPDLTVQKVDNHLLEAIRGNGICCFIVDNHDAIGDRYFNFAGTVVKVHKFKDVSKIDGLYVMGMDASKKATISDHIPLDKIDESSFIFKSQEEANLGADKTTAYRDAVELTKLDLGAVNMELKHQLDIQAYNNKVEHEKLMQSIREEAAREAKKREEEAAISRRKFEEELQKLRVEKEQVKQGTERIKFDYDTHRFNYDVRSLHHKSNYEEGKWERDSSIETIKTVGAIAGLTLAGMAVFGKLNK